MYNVSKKVKKFLGDVLLLINDEGYGIKKQEIVIERNRHIEQAEIQDEFEIIKKAKGDPKYFRVLYDRYFTIIFRFIYRRIDDEQITADLTSQTFLKALRNLKKYKYQGVPFSAWLYRIATNEVNKYYQNNKRTLVYSLEEPIFQELITQNAEDIEVGEYDYLIKELNSLCDSDIEVIELRFFESKSFAEMAFILDISEASAKMRTYRAIDKLKALIKKRTHDKV